MCMGGSMSPTSFIATFRVSQHGQRGRVPVALEAPRSRPLHNVGAQGIGLIGRWGWLPVAIEAPQRRLARRVECPRVDWPDQRGRRCPTGECLAIEIRMRDGVDYSRPPVGD